jgi:hypothetical protein
MQSLANKPQSDYYFANGSAGLGISKQPILPLWTPAEITTALWYDADDSSTITIATAVSQWDDKSGNTRNATQATGAFQPAVITAGLNGKNVIRFDGSNDTLGYTGTFFANTSYTVHAVVARRSSQSLNFFMAGSGTSTNTNLLLGWENNTTFRHAQYSNDIDATEVGYSSPIFNVWGVGLNTAVGRFIFRNGTSANSNATTTALSSYNGATLGGPFFGSHYNGDIAELIATTTVLSTTDRQKMEGYLAWKWGLQASLPNDHPYKAAAPIL